MLFACKTLPSCSKFLAIKIPFVSSVLLTHKRLTIHKRLLTRKSLVTRKTLVTNKSLSTQKNLLISKARGAHKMLFTHLRGAARSQNIDHSQIVAR